MAGSSFTLRSLQILIDRIRRILVSEVPAPREEVEELYREYDEVVRETNDRLRECDELLHEGNRSEALQLCAREPDLLRVVSILDFAERLLWHEKIAEHQLAPPPSPQFDIAGELNEAHNLEAPLTELMRMHRLHALAGSPLRTRLEFLRKIAERETGIARWTEDIEVFERARHLQIEQELATCKSKGDVALSSLLEREVRSSPWREKPPEALVEGVVRTHNHLRQRQAASRLRDLAVKLHEAYGEKDETAARGHFAAWNAQVALAGLPATDPIFEQVEPVISWLDREAARREQAKAHREAIGALEHALDSGAGEVEIDRCLAQVERFGPIPEELLNKAELRKQTLGRNRRTRMIGFTVSTVLFMLLVSGGLVWYIRHAQQRALLVKHEAVLKNFIEEGKRTEAKEFLEELTRAHPEEAKSPEIQRLATELEAKLREEADRIALLEQRKAELEVVVRDDDWDMLEAAIPRAIEVRKTLCKSPAEDLEVERIEDALRQGVKRHQADRDAEFSAALKPLVDALPTVGTEKEKIDRLELQVKELLAMPRVSSELKQQATAIITRLDATKRSIDGNRRETTLLSEIASQAGNAVGYEAALDKYVKEFSATARAAAITRVRDKETAMRAEAAKWNRAAAKFSEVEVRTCNPQRAAELIQELEAQAALLDKFPQAAEIKEMRPFLEAITRRVNAEGKRVTSELQAILEEPFIKDLNWVVSLKDGKKYYFVKPPARRATGFVFQSCVDSSLEKTERAELDDAEVARDPEGRFNWTSPQQKFRADTLKLLDELTDEKWEATFFERLKTLESDRDMEPTLRLYFIKVVLRLGCSGSHCLNQGFQRRRELLESVDDPDVNANWMNPLDDVGNKARKDSLDTLRRLEQVESIGTCGKTAGTLFMQAAKRKRGSQYQWVGCLLKDASDAWTMPTPKLAPTAAGKLVMLIEDENGRVTVQPVGVATAGKSKLTVADAAVLTEGRGVYLEE